MLVSVFTINTCPPVVGDISSSLAQDFIFVCILSHKVSWHLNLLRLYLFKESYKAGDRRPLRMVHMHTNKTKRESWLARYIRAVGMITWPNWKIERCAKCGEASKGFISPRAAGTSTGKVHSRRRLIKSACKKKGFPFILVQNRCKFNTHYEKCVFWLANKERGTFAARPGICHRLFNADVCKLQSFLFLSWNKTPFRCSSCNVFHL